MIRTSRTKFVALAAVLMGLTAITPQTALGQLAFRLAPTGTPGILLPSWQYQENRRQWEPRSPTCPTSPVANETPATTAKVGPEVTAPRLPSAWTLDEALELLRLQPRDAYLQYVVLQLARRADRLAEVSTQVETISFDKHSSKTQRTAGSLFGLLGSGAATQERVQFDLMRGEVSASDPTTAGLFVTPPTPQVSGPNPPVVSDNSPAPVATPVTNYNPVNVPAPSMPPVVDDEEQETQAAEMEGTPHQKSKLQETNDYYEVPPPQYIIPEQAVYNFPVSGGFSNPPWMVRAPQASPNQPTVNATPTTPICPSSGSRCIHSQEAPVSTSSTDVTETAIAPLPQQPPRGEPMPDSCVLPTSVEPAPEPTKMKRTGPVDLSELKAPDFPERPWAKLLGDHKAEVSFLSCCVPADFYFAEFRSAAKLIEACDTCDQWGKFLSIQALQDTRGLDLRQRMMEQLVVSDGWKRLKIQSVAWVGSDLFLTEGSDLTLLVQHAPDDDPIGNEQGKWLPDYMRQFPNFCRGKHLELSVGRLLGVRYVYTGTADRSICVYTALPKPGLQVRTNSLAALKRIIETIQGKDAAGQPVQSLGDTAEFQYVRKQQPPNADEDGFLYFSEPFLKHLVSPAVQIKQQRRQLAHAHLRMIGYAAQMYRGEQGRLPDALGTLSAADCVPGAFNAGKLASPGGGQYSLADDGLTGVSTVYGRADFLTPCCELELGQATGEEADAYEAFAVKFSESFKSAHNPVALRLQLTDKRIRVEAWTPPPRIGEAMYDTVQQIFGGEPEALDALPVPKRNLFSLNVHFNRQGLLGELWKALEPEKAKKLAELREAVALATALDAAAPVAVVGWPLVVAYDHTLQVAWESGSASEKLQEGTVKQLAQSAGVEKESLELLKSFEAFVKKGIGSQVGVHAYDTAIMFDINYLAFLHQLSSGNDQAGGMGGMGLMVGAAAGALTSPLYLAIPVRDAAVVDDFLGRLDTMLPPFGAKTKTVTFWNYEVDLYHMITAGQTKVRTCAVRFGPARYRFYLGRIGDGLYIANSPVVFTDIEAAHRERENIPVAKRDVGPKAHAMLRLRANHWDQALPGFKLGWAENDRLACIHNLGPLSSTARSLSATAGNLSWNDRARQVPEVAAKVYGTAFCCPEGGRYELATEGRAMTCSVHGSALAARQPLEPNASLAAKLMGNLTDVTAAVTLTPEGVRMTLTVDRK